MSKSKATPKQQEIIKLLYKYRFLERKHIQQYLGHTNKSRIIRWLKDLKEKRFVDWIYDADNPNERSKPAVYFLDTNGIGLLRSLGVYPEDELRKRYKDSSRQQDFIDRCLLLADCCLHLEARNNEDADTLHYDYAIETDYMDSDDDFYYLSESEFIHPDLAFTKRLDSEGELINQTYFVQLFDVSTPRYMVKKRIKGYVEYLASDEWEQVMGGEELPIVMIAFPKLAELIYAKRYTKMQLDEVWDDDIPEEVKIRFSTIEKVKLKGVTAVIWEDL
jgi:hypothetical protein